MNTGRLQRCLKSYEDLYGNDDDQRYIYDEYLGCNADAGTLLLIV